MRPEERPKRHVSIEEVKSILEDIKGDVAERYGSIFGIPRGGLPVATILSLKTDLPVLLSKWEIGKDTLVVDDIVDHGTTLRGLFAHCETFGPDKRRPDVFALYFRTRKFTFVFPSQDAGDDWIVFPWEDEESSKYDRTFT